MFRSLTQNITRTCARSSLVNVQSRAFFSSTNYKVEILQRGTGVKPKKGDTVTVHYTGKLQDGTVFDTSLKRGPFKFIIGVGQVIKGWDEIVNHDVGVGSKIELTCPPSYAYGMSGIPGVIPRNATLIFDVELLDVTST